MSLTTSSTVSVLAASPSISVAAGGAAVDMAPLSITIPALLSLLRAGTPTDMTALRELIGAAAAESAATASAAPVKVAKAKVGRPKAAAAAASVAILPLPLPEAGADGAPEVAAYRMMGIAIDVSICVARKLDGGEDKRWKPTVYRESQCGKPLKNGCDLCTTCDGREEKFATSAKPGAWNGRVTEEPPAWCHMLGTTWADDKSPKWMGAASASASASGTASASDSGSDSDVSEQMSASASGAGASKAAAAATKKAEKEAAAAAKAAEKEAAAAAKAAEKEAKKAAAAAAKAAAAEAKKAEKAAAKPPKAAKEPKAAKAAKEPKAKAEKAATAAASTPAKASAAAEPVAVAGELKLIDGTLYMLKSGNVYEYDELSEKAGDFVGRLTEDGEAIDPDAEEEGAAEEDDE